MLGHSYSPTNGRDIQSCTASTMACFVFTAKRYRNEIDGLGGVCVPWALSVVYSTLPNPHAHFTHRRILLRGHLDTRQKGHKSRVCEPSLSSSVHKRKSDASLRTIYISMLTACVYGFPAGGQDKASGNCNCIPKYRRKQRKIRAVWWRTKLAHTWPIKSEGPRSQAKLH